jgi:hypothetical protein
MTEQARETPEPLTPEEHAALDALNAAEARFWKAESTWADKGSGMTRDQQTGASMAFLWLRTTRPVALRAVTPDRPRAAGPWTGDPADYDGDEGR